MPNVTRYHPALVALHWLLALFIPAALALGALVLAKIPNASPMKIEGLRSHMIGGMLILALMLLRLFVRTGTAHPPAAAAGHPLLDRVAWWSHRLLYALVIAMAASGLFMALQTRLFVSVLGGGGPLPADFWAFPIRWVHYLVSRLLMALIALHVAGALYHAFIRKDGLLRRMVFGRRFAAAREAAVSPSASSR